MTAESYRSRKLWKLLLWLACLLLVIIGSSFFFIAKIQGRQVSLPPERHTTATVSVSTPTETPSPTPIASLTPTLTPQPLFVDYFVDNSKGWLVGDSAGAGYNRTIDLNGLTLSATNHKVLIESLPGNNTYDDFTLTTSFIFQQGDGNDSMGLYLRGDSNLDHDYRIDIYGNSTYDIIKESLDPNNTPINTELVPPSHTSALKPMRQENTLSVTLKGSTLVLTINNVILNSLTDTDYTHGQIALFVQNGSTSNGVLSSFNNISIYPPPDQLPDTSSQQTQPALTPTTSTHPNQP